MVRSRQLLLIQAPLHLFLLSAFMPVYNPGTALNGKCPWRQAGIFRKFPRMLDEILHLLFCILEKHSAAKQRSCSVHASTFRFLLNGMRWPTQFINYQEDAHARAF